LTDLDLIHPEIGGNQPDDGPVSGLHHQAGIMIRNVRDTNRIPAGREDKSKTPEGIAGRPCFLMEPGNIGIDDRLATLVIKQNALIVIGSGQSCHTQNQKDEKGNKKRTVSSPV